MFTDTGHRPRSLAAFCAAVAAAVALVLVPSLSASAVDDDLTALATAADSARAAANAAAGAADAAEADAAAAASEAATAAAAADAACAAATAAAAAAAAAPEDATVQQAAVDAQSACDSAQGTAATAQSTASAAAGAASSARDNANSLEAVAQEAEAAYQAAQAADQNSQKAAVEPTIVEPDDPVVDPEPAPDTTPPAECEATDDSTGEPGTDESESSEPESSEPESTDPESTDGSTGTESDTQADPNDDTSATDPCAEMSVESFSRVQNCDRDISFFSQNKDWDWCFPDPKIEIDVKNYCPTTVKVEITHLWPWVDYTVKVNGVVQPIEINQWGKASFTLENVADGKFEVKIYKGERTLGSEHTWIKNHCPDIDVETGQCTTIGGTAPVGLWVSDLDDWRKYTITVTGPNGIVLNETAWGPSSWSSYLDLPPGDYTVTVTSDGGRYKPDIGPVYKWFTVAPCPGDVTITINPTCGASGSGSLGATLSGLVPGREYWVTVVGPDGTVTDVTFVASEPTWAVPPEHLPPGTYTVTVVDTASNSSPVYAAKVAEPEYDPLTWTATGTISACPALASTGAGPASQLLPALALLPLGAALIVASRLRRRTTGTEKGAGEEAA